MESALVESESRFRNMADFAPVMIWTVEPDKSWNYCNKPWLEFTGLTAEQSSGFGWTALVHRHDLSRVLETYDRAFATRQEFTLEYRFRRGDGHYRSIVNRAVPRTGFEGEFAGFIGSCTDITELKAAEDRLNAAKLESLGILAGGIAHDFNNLLTGIMGNTSLVLDDLPLDSTAVPYLQNVLLASETAARLTRQMLAYAGKGQFVVEQVDVSQVVQETLPLIESSLSRLVNFKLELARNLPAVEADRGQVQQLVMNLVINAAEAAGSVRGGLVTIWTSLEVLDDAGTAAMLAGFPVPAGRYVMLRVRDNGCGMDEVTKTRIFDPFFSTKFTGRGLGLAAVSGIVRSHRGGISLASELGAGSDFRVYLRVSAAVTGTAVKVEVQRALSGSGTILVVDDETIVSETARLILEKFGYRVIIARDGQEAVDLFRAHASEIDLVLLDMDMPVMPGEIAFPQIRAIRPHTPVIVTSGFDEAEAVRRFGSDIDTFLQKPYTAVQLINRVDASRRA
jgi:PAS domain S-box-containing protein